jgi:hypothetical protein
MRIVEPKPRGVKPIIMNRDQFIEWLSDAMPLPIVNLILSTLERHELLEKALKEDAHHDVIGLILSMYNASDRRYKFWDKVWSALYYDEGHCFPKIPKYAAADL